MKGVVLDASVVLKWYLADEALGEKALGLLHRHASQELDILGPSLLEYEVINGLVVAQKRGRLGEDTLFAAMAGFFDLGISLRGLSLFHHQVLHYCSVYHRSAYDASYLAVAEGEGVPLITADEGLFNAVKKELKWVKWLGDVR